MPDMRLVQRLRDSHPGLVAGMRGTVLPGLAGGATIALISLALQVDSQVASVALASASALPFIAGAATEVARSRRREKTGAALLQRATLVDQLSGLPNQAFLDIHLSGGALRTGTSVVMCDIEGLDEVNDRHGRRAGDEVIVLAAQKLQSVLGPEAFVARVGGDEFFAVLTERLNPSQLRAIGASLREAVISPSAVNHPVRLAVGLAHATDVEAATAQRHARKALAEAKRTHTGVAYLDHHLRRTLDAHAASVAELELAISREQIIAHFQPVVDPVTLTTVGAEALARWQAGSQLRPPAAWLPLAESTGLILPVGEAIFASARRASDLHGIPVAVNMSASQLDDPDALLRIERSWGRDNWDKLIVEITEGAVARNPAGAKSTLSELARRGVRISLDDFGTGYNSLASLGSMPLHQLKIDRSMVAESHTDEGHAVLVAIVQMSRIHGLEIVAEGVETRPQLQVMLSLGVDQVQGNLLGRPRADLGRGITPPNQRRQAADVASTSAIALR